MLYPFDSCSFRDRSWPEPVTALRRCRIAVTVVICSVPAAANRITPAWRSLWTCSPSDWANAPPCALGFGQQAYELASLNTRPTLVHLPYPPLSIARCQSWLTSARNTLCQGHCYQSRLPYLVRLVCSSVTWIHDCVSSTKPPHHRLRGLKFGSLVLHVRRRKQK